ncbi:MAG: class I SAM-dependent methyltransferase [Sphingobacteriia bacterium]|jgi:ubiquinone/menaquinone biosynthesis C-methylase UbiE|nr:MAG: class I SAM-dependent methyltransferase [Sphingobacteriia bacterium]TAH09345.1 MAG: class I SAM-dependent methyltransferase [Sphingobacteriia bacterium]
MLLNRIILERKIKGTLSKYFRIKFTTKSETAKVRSRVLSYCIGKGCDIGFGGDKISKVNCVGIDLPQPYTTTGKDGVDIGCDVIREEIPVADNTFDYVYTSHLIEDFTDTKDALRKFIRILKENGTLILVFPDQIKYEFICKNAGIILNPYHVHPNMGRDYMIDKLNELTNINYQILYQSNCEIDYNVILVLKITKK